MSLLIALRLSERSRVIYFSRSKLYIDAEGGVISSPSSVKY